MLFTGLPWAKQWGGYLKEIRRLTGTAVAQQDWPSGHPASHSPLMAAGHQEHAAHGGGSGTTPDAGVSPSDYTAIDRLVTTMAPLNLAPPVLISPPAKGSPNWTAKSDAQNRTLRVNLVLDGATGAILKREDFKNRHWIDRLVAVGVAAHEGQLFGWPNQLLNTMTALGLLLLCLSAAVMWWRRWAQGVLGAPEPIQRPRFALGLGLIVLALAVYLPLFGLSMIVVKLAERFVFCRIPSVRTWLGLHAAPSYQPQGENT